MWDNSCRWVVSRLPLLAGDELIGPERRQAERHLIGCPACRERLASLRSALGVLRTVGQDGPESPGAPSLWPALARQIKESRRVPRHAWDHARVLTWVRVGLAATVLLTASGLGVWLLSQKYRVTVDIQPVSKPRQTYPFAHRPTRPPIQFTTTRRQVEEPEPPLVEPRLTERHPESDDLARGPTPPPVDARHGIEQPTN